LFENIDPGEVASLDGRIRRSLRHEASFHGRGSLPDRCDGQAGK
jgi:hypothetical protein